MTAIVLFFVRNVSCLACWEGTLVVDGSRRVGFKTNRNPLIAFLFMLSDVPDRKNRTSCRHGTLVVGNDKEVGLNACSFVSYLWGA